MRVILLEDVQNLGIMGDIVKVSDGYGRNYLIPQKLAILATEQKAKSFEHQRKIIEAKKEKLKAEAKEKIGHLENLSITIAKQAGEDDKLFGSVTNRDIQEALAELGHEIDRRKIIVDKPIRELGIYKIQIKLIAEINAHIKVWVVAA